MSSKKQQQKSVKTKTTKYSLHVEKWKDCQACSCAQGRNRVVLARGDVPCKVLFIGEAPGESEDTLGSPFVGVAGHLLEQKIIRNVFCDKLSGMTRAFTNILACIPREDTEDRKRGSKLAEPEHEQVDACQPRLAEFIKICNPKLIICLGKHAREWVGGDFKFSLKVNVPCIPVIHPSAINRMPLAKKSLECQRAVVIIQDAIDKYITNNAPYVNEEPPF